MNRLLFIVVVIVWPAATARAMDDHPPGSSPTAGAPTAESSQPLAIVGYLPYYDTESFEPSAGADLIYFSVEPTPAGDLRDEGTKDGRIQILVS